MKKYGFIVGIIFILFYSVFFVSSCVDKPNDRTNRVNELYEENKEGVDNIECGKYCIGENCKDFGNCEKGEYCEKNKCEKACVDMNCGTDHGISCGNCEKNWKCGTNNVCYNPCQGKECGKSEGIICGHCEGKTWCNKDQFCEKACVDMNCGTDHGISCGNCEKNWKCGTNNVCYNPCQGKECGKSENVICGYCEGKSWCNENQICEKACIDMNCGTDHGILCGNCDEDWKCGANNVCYNPCQGKECGELEGIFCGSCKNNQFCENNYCYNSCDKMNCGTDHGISCGNCDEDWKCGTNNVCYNPCQGKECGKSENISCGSCNAENGYWCDKNLCEKFVCENQCWYSPYKNPETINNRFTQSGGSEYIKTDSYTNLKWIGIAVQSKTWEEAMEYCLNLTYGGRDDWRLPDSYELESLINYSKLENMFPPEFWSSSERGDSDAWYVDFNCGCVILGAKSTKYNVFCVAN